MARKKTPFGSRKKLPWEKEDKKKKEKEQKKGGGGGSDKGETFNYKGKKVTEKDYDILTGRKGGKLSEEGKKVMEEKGRMVFGEKESGKKGFVGQTKPKEREGEKGKEKVSVSQDDMVGGEEQGSRVVERAKKAVEGLKGVGGEIKSFIDYTNINKRLEKEGSDIEVAGQPVPLGMGGTGILSKVGKAKPLLTSKYLKTIAKVGGVVSGVSSMMTWLASDNILTSMSMYSRDLREGVKWGDIGQDEALQKLDEAEQNMETAKNFVEVNTMLNPMLWPFKSIVETNVDGVEMMMQNNREQIMSYGVNENETEK